MSKVRLDRQFTMLRKQLRLAQNAMQKMSVDARASGEALEKLRLAHDMLFDLKHDVMRYRDALGTTQESPSRQSS